MPTTDIRNIMNGLDVAMCPSGEVDPVIASGDIDADSFLHHPVRQANYKKLHHARIRPVSLFCDGFQYTKRDNAFGFYMRDMRTKREFVNFIISSLALHLGSCKLGRCIICWKLQFLFASALRLPTDAQL